MPRDTTDVGSHGLEQGGANLGNDYSRPITSARNEQNTTTNVGSHPSESNQKENSNNEMDTKSGGDEGGSTPDPEEIALDEDDETSK